MSERRLNNDIVTIPYIQHCYHKILHTRLPPLAIPPRPTSALKVTFALVPPPRRLPRRSPHDSMAAPIAPSASTPATELNRIRFETELEVTPRPPSRAAAHPLVPSSYNASPIPFTFNVSRVRVVELSCIEEWDGSVGSERTV
jgi:hypothetical protein